MALTKLSRQNRRRCACFKLQIFPKIVTLFVIGFDLEQKIKSNHPANY